MVTMSYRSAHNSPIRGLCKCLFFAVALSTMLFAFATELEAGKAFAKSKGCFECHGLSGNESRDSEPAWPKLAGMPKLYLMKAMKDYRSGARQDETMSLMMSVRTDEEIELLAVYYSAQKRY